MDAISTNISDTKELLNSFKHDLVQRCQLIRIEEVSAITTLAKSSINLWVAQSKFPKPITLSATVKVWKLQEVVNWIEAQHNSKEASI